MSRTEDARRLWEEGILAASQVSALVNQGPGNRIRHGQETVCAARGTLGRVVCAVGDKKWALFHFGSRGVDDG